MLQIPIIFPLLFIFLVNLSSQTEVISADHETNPFIKCLSLQYQNDISTDSSKLVFTTGSSSYSSILHFSIHNLRFNSTIRHYPQAIITPLVESQVPPVIFCAKRHQIHVRIRSGGHDYEGLSYTSKVPFVILDLIHLQSVDVDASRRTAWVQSGATVGDVYYRIAEKSKTLAFPASVCPSVGVGGLFSGGGYGTLLRKYGLAADNIVDARIADANGRILDRKSMGEELFWAIRGGGGNSFGVILAWKIKLVTVPPKVTVFTIRKTLDQNATVLLHRWQYVASKFVEDLFVRIVILNAVEANGRIKTQVAFNSIFLGGVDRLLRVMQKSFPELGLQKNDCTEMSWIESTLYFNGYPRGTPLEVLMDRTLAMQTYKAKSDYVREPISEEGLEGIWRYFQEKEAERAVLIFSPYGGKMDKISDSATPFPHRAGNLYKIQHLVYWTEPGTEATKKHIEWIRRFYSYMGPYVSKNPRSAYVNYRDLDLGVNKEGKKTSVEEAKLGWGLKYFGNNFDRLVQVKTMVDPLNFFRNEQSVPPSSE